MHLLILLFRVYEPDGAIIQYEYLNRVYFDCKTKLGPYSSWDRQGKYIYTQESFYVQGMLKDINEQDTSFLDCKHKHMMQSGALPDKVGVLHRLLRIELHGFTSRIESSIISVWFLVLSQFFIDSIGPFNYYSLTSLIMLNHANS